MKRTLRSLLALGLTWMIAWPPGLARADSLCLPAAQGVPTLPGPPDWSAAGGPFGKKINDPRWVGAVRDDLPIAGTGVMPEVAVRGLFNGTKVYLSFQTLVDNDGVTTDKDSVYVGFATAAGDARILKVTFAAAGPLNGDLNPASRALQTWSLAAGTWSSSGVVQAWATTANAIALWADAPGGATNHTWAVNMTFDTGVGSPLRTELGGAAITKIWYQVARYHGTATGDLLDARHKWPPGSQAFIDASPSNNVTTWGLLKLGTSDPTCPSGISIDPFQIGTLRSGLITSQVDTTTGPGTGNKNRFIARPNPGPTSNSEIQGTFRIADWGSQIDASTASWMVIASGVANVAGDVAWTCGDGEASTCPALSHADANPDQCMLVELSGLNPPGGQPVHFIRSSARRNMAFVSLSKFQREATISVKGLAPLTGTTDRDVYIFVKTRNMPDAGARRGPPPDGRRFMGAMVIRKTGMDAVAQRSEVSGGQSPIFEEAAAVLPTYEVHVYHTTGQETSVGGHTIRTVEPQAAFGYFALHDTTPEGWRHRLEGVGVALEEVGPNLYHVKVPNNGEVKVRTKIATCERVLFGCCCHVGQHDGGLAGPALVVVLLVLVSRRRRDRRRVVTGACWP